MELGYEHSPPPNLDSTESLRLAEQNAVDARLRAIDHLEELKAKEAQVRIVGIPVDSATVVPQDSGGITIYQTRCLVERDEEGNMVPWTVDGGSILSIESSWQGDVVKISRGDQGAYTTFRLDSISEFDVLGVTDAQPE